MEQETNYDNQPGASEQEAKELIRHLNQGESIYFDVDQYEGYIDFFIQKDQLSNALRINEYAIKQHESSVSLWIKKSQIIFNLGRINEAIELAQHCLMFEPTNAELYYLIGTGYLNNNNTSKAKSYFDQALTCESEHIDEILFNIGYAYEQVFDYESAITFFRGAIRKNNQNINAIYDLAYCYDKIENYKKAVWAYKHYLEIDPYNTSVWFNLGIALNHLEKADEALEAYDYALAINEKHTSALFNKANILANQLNYDDAIEAYKAYLELDPESDEAYCYLADCFFNKRDYESAIHTYKEAFKINAENDSAWYGGALILLLTEEYDQCMTFLKQTVKINPDISDYWISIGKVALMLNHYEEGEYAFEKAIFLTPKEPEVWAEMAAFYHHYDQTAMAVDTLKRSSAFIQNDAELCYALAGYAFIDSQYNYGYKYLERAISIDRNAIDNLFFELFPEMEKLEQVKEVMQNHNIKHLIATKH
jgi:tetratricopeptide (TPR) repeat protein